MNASNRIKNGLILTVHIQPYPTTHGDRNAVGSDTEVGAPVETRDFGYCDTLAVIHLGCRKKWADEVAEKVSREGYEMRDALHNGDHTHSRIPTYRLHIASGGLAVSMVVEIRA